jgi:hypothetical protein
MHQRLNHTPLTLVVVPALYVGGSDVGELFRRAA